MMEKIPVEIFEYVNAIDILICLNISKIEMLSKFCQIFVTTFYDYIIPL